MFTRGNGATRLENEAAASEVRLRLALPVGAYVVLDPAGLEVDRYADILSARDCEREYGTGACTVTPEGRVLSFRAGVDVPSGQAYAAALRAVEAWRSARLAVQ